MIDWDQLIRDDGPAVWRTAFRLLGNRADAEECFQEAFADAIGVARSNSGGSIRSWRAMLVRLATARAVDRLRQRIRRASHESGDGDVHRLVDHRIDSRPLDRAEQMEMSERLRSALAHLPPKQADAFCLHCLEGWSCREVAELMDEDANNIGVLVHRARATLKERIGFILSGASTGASESRIQNRLQIPSSDPVGEVKHEQ